MKKIVLLLALLAPAAALAGEYDGVYSCSINITGQGNIASFASLHSRADGSAAFVQSTPVKPAMSIYGYAIGSFNGAAFSGVSGDGTALAFTVSSGAFSFSGTFAYNGSELPAVYTCSKVW